MDGEFKGERKNKVPNRSTDKGGYGHYINAFLKTPFNSILKTPFNSVLKPTLPFVRS